MNKDCELREIPTHPDFSEFFATDAMLKPADGENPRLSKTDAGAKGRPLAGDVQPDRTIRTIQLYRLILDHRAETLPRTVDLSLCRSHL